MCRQRKSLEARSLTDEDRIAQLEKQLAEAQIIAEDADRRYDEVRKFFFFYKRFFSLYFIISIH